MEEVSLSESRMFYACEIKMRTPPERLSVLLRSQIPTGKPICLPERRRKDQVLKLKLGDEAAFERGWKDP
eukprot:2805828-Rhodomonas_salina.1